jgi:hypothetical protein
MMMTTVRAKVTTFAIIIGQFHSIIPSANQSATPIANVMHPKRDTCRLATVNNFIGLGYGSGLTPFLWQPPQTGEITQGTPSRKRQQKIAGSP